MEVNSLFETKAIRKGIEKMHVNSCRKQLFLRAGLPVLKPESQSRLFHKAGLQTGKLCGEGSPWRSARKVEELIW